MSEKRDDHDQPDWVTHYGDATLDAERSQCPMVGERQYL